jgi:hypothetical protein
MPYYPQYYGDDGNYDFDSYRRPSPHHHHSDYRRSAHLDPGYTSAGLHRSRSTGHGPAPVINIHNRMSQENDNRSPSPQPPYMPQPYMQPPPFVAYPVPYPTATRASPRATPRSSPEPRGRRLGDRLGDALDVDLAEMVLDHRYGRSRSRGRSDASVMPAAVPVPSLAEWQLKQLEAERKEAERQAKWKAEEERLINKFKIEALEAAAKQEKADEAAKENEKRVLENYQRKQREKAEEEKRLTAEFEQKQRDRKAAEQAEEQRIKDKIEKDKIAAEEKREREYKEFKQREKDKADKEQREYEEFLKKQKEKKEKEAKAAKEAEETFQNEMRKRLANLGYTEKTIEIMVDEEKAKKFKTQVEKKDDPFQPPRAPVYPKIKCKYIAMETLRYYQLPWKYDPVCHTVPTSLREFC